MLTKRIEELEEITKNKADYSDIEEIHRYTGEQWKWLVRLDKKIEKLERGDSKFQQDIIKLFVEGDSVLENDIIILQQRLEKIDLKLISLDRQHASNIDDYSDIQEIHLYATELRFLVSRLEQRIEKLEKLIKEK
jgi:hypothetical protein